MTDKPHSVFTDLPPMIPDGVEVPRHERCFGTACSMYDRDGPQRCPTGRCQRFEDAVVKLADLQEAAQ